MEDPLRVSTLYCGRFNHIKTMILIQEFPAAKLNTEAYHGYNAAPFSPHPGPSFIAKSAPSGTGIRKIISFPLRDVFYTKIRKTANEKKPI
jgi:hypothetical protein